MTRLLKHISNSVDLTRGKDRLSIRILQILFMMVVISVFSAGLSAQIWNEDFESDTVGSQQGNGTPSKWISFYETTVFDLSSIINETSNITVSIGAAQFIPEEKMEAFIKRADDALYVAKQKGKNRVSSL